MEREVAQRALAEVHGTRGLREGCRESISPLRAKVARFESNSSYVRDREPSYENAIPPEARLSDDEFPQVFVHLAFLREARF